jgi:hypothetical protein
MLISAASVEADIHANRKVPANRRRINEAFRSGSVWVALSTDHSVRLRRSRLKRSATSSPRGDDAHAIADPGNYRSPGPEARCCRRSARPKVRAPRGIGSQKQATVVYGAPPLLSEKALQGIDRCLARVTRPIPIARPLPDIADHVVEATAPLA